MKHNHIEYLKEKTEKPCHGDLIQTPETTHISPMSISVLERTLWRALGPKSGGH